MSTVRVHLSLCAAATLRSMWRGSCIRISLARRNSRVFGAAGPSTASRWGRSTGVAEGGPRAARQIMLLDRKPRAASATPGLSAFSRSDGFQLRLHFFRLPRLSLRAIGLRARPRALDHRLWFFARTRLFHCPLRKESFLVAHSRPPVMTYLWSPRTEDNITTATPAVVWRSRCRAPFAK